MSVDTKGVVICKKSEKDVFLVINGIMEALRIHAKYQNKIKIDMSNHHMKCIQVFFQDNTIDDDKNNNRRLFVSFDSDCDYDDEIFGINANGISFSLGAWGNSVEIMKSVVKEVARLINGKTFIDENDCDDIYYYELT